ncbi:MAG: sensor histidine kinase, partial [Kiritimatiellia bacterium]
MRIERLSTRLFLSFSAFSVCMLGVLALFTWMSYQAGREAAAQKMLISAVEEWKQNPSGPLPSGDLLYSFVGESRMPERLRKHLDDFEPEDYEVPLWEWKEIQLWKGEYPFTGERVYVFLELGDTDDQAVFAPNLERGILLGGGVVLAGAVGLGFLISRRLSGPLRSLCRDIAETGPDQAFRRLADCYPDGETGEVARAFDGLQERLQRFVERERRFTGDASHELRTPLTLMRTATRVLRNSIVEPELKQQRALQHLEQGVEEMTRSVESFLYLARERHLGPSLEGDRPGEVLQHTIAFQCAQLERPAEAVQLRVTGEPNLQVSVELFRVVAGNLIRNGLQHGAGKPVRVSLSDTDLVVMDHGPGLRGEVLACLGKPFPPGGCPEGVGLGLSITHEISQRAGWTVSWESAGKQGTRARVVFHTMTPAPT